MRKIKIMKNYSQALSNLVKRIAEEIKPLRVILFGSVAKNTMSEESDIDLLVVMPEGTHRRHTAQWIYKNIRNIGVPFDVLVVTDRDLERYQNSAGLIYQEILAEGIEVYVL
jgi:predicted nucleotidyltransferase